MFGGLRIYQFGLWVIVMGIINYFLTFIDQMINQWERWIDSENNRWLQLKIWYPVLLYIDENVVNEVISVAAHKPLST